LRKTPQGGKHSLYWPLRDDQKASVSGNSEEVRSDCAVTFRGGRIRKKKTSAKVECEGKKKTP